MRSMVHVLIHMTSDKAHMCEVFHGIDAPPTTSTAMLVLACIYGTSRYTECSGRSTEEDCHIEQIIVLVKQCICVLTTPTLVIESSLF